MTRTFELDILANISKVLTENSNPIDIVTKLNAIFNKFIDLDKLEIYVYDENTKTLRDFSKSWIIIDEFHKNAQADKLYLALAQFGQYDFFINSKAYKAESFKTPDDIKIKEKNNTILFPLLKRNKPYGVIKLDFLEDISKILTPELFKTFSIAAYQISLKIQNTILAEQMQINIDFHEAMKNIAKIIETQYELNYIIPLIGEMVDRFISDHLIYIFLKNETEKGFNLVWPKACRDKKITALVSKITAKSKHMTRK